MKVIYSFLHVVEADGSIQLRTDTQVYLDCDDESKHDNIINYFMYYFRMYVLPYGRIIFLAIVITMDGRRCSSKFIAYVRYARIKVRVFHSWARVRRNGPSAQFVRRSVGSLRRIGTWAPA